MKFLLSYLFVSFSCVSSCVSSCGPDRFSSSYIKARQESRGSRTWVSSQSMVILESEDSEEDHIDKHGYELCDAIGYDSTSKVEYDNVFLHIPEGKEID